VLDLRDAETLLGAARAIWAASGQVTQADIELTRGVTLSIADLAGATLGLANPGSIALDVNAAGHGWFVDRTPLRSEEYVIDASGQLAARDGTRADGRIDLLSVLVHELGHIMGFEHDDGVPGGAMNETIDIGERLLVDGVLTVVPTPIMAMPSLTTYGMAQLFHETLGAFVDPAEADLLEQHGLPGAAGKMRKLAPLAPLPALPPAASSTATAAIDWSRGWGRDRGGTQGLS
jgi:hypothetical protein